MITVSYTGIHLWHFGKAAFSVIAFSIIVPKILFSPRHVFILVTFTSIYDLIDVIDSFKIIFVTEHLCF